MEAKDIGKWSFLLGVLIAIASAFTTDIISPSIVIAILFVLGLVVGFLSIDRKSTSSFLIAIIFLLVLGVGGISALSEIPFVSGIYDYIATMLAGFVTFVAAAGLVVAIKAIIDTNEGLFSAFKK